MSFNEVLLRQTLASLLIVGLGAFVKWVYNTAFPKEPIPLYDILPGEEERRLTEARKKWIGITTAIVVFVLVEWGFWG